MSRNLRQVPVRLDFKGVTHLSPTDLAAILRAADPLIMSGGRTLLSKILKGSHDRKIIELKLDACPTFGYYKQLDHIDILARIDWAILNGYLTLEYSGRLPLLSYTPQGWEIEKDTYSTELLQTLKDMAVHKCRSEDCSFLKDKNRSLILLLLDKIAYSKDPTYIYVLKLWEQIEYKRVRQRIQQVIQAIDKITPDHKV
jgi:superfamily II DNA helicase RecQ